VTYEKTLPPSLPPSLPHYKYRPLPIRPALPPSLPPSLPYLDDSHTSIELAHDVPLELRGGGDLGREGGKEGGREGLVRICRNQMDASEGEEWREGGREGGMEGWRGSPLD